MSHIHIKHALPNPEDRMAIGYVAPQPPNVSQHLPQLALPRQDSGASAAARLQLLSVVYGAIIQASMMSAHVSPATPYKRRYLPPQIPALSSSQTRKPITSPVHDRCCSVVKAPPKHKSPRARRDPYSKEMQLFIMFARIYKEREWRKIQNDFGRTFNQRRPLDGLTAVYYRTRNKWGMQQVLKSGPDKYNTDNPVMGSQARSLDRDFLTKIGYTG